MKRFIEREYYFERFKFISQKFVEPHFWKNYETFGQPGGGGLIFQVYQNNSACMYCVTFNKISLIVFAPTLVAFGAQQQ